MFAAIGAARHNRKKRAARLAARAARAREREETPSRPVIDLRSLASAVVPAHGLVMSSRGISAGGLAGKFFFWFKKLLGAVSVAGMIALGLFIYTEFTQAWQKRGLPMIPISALVALDDATHQGPSTRGPTSSRGDTYRPRGRGDSRQQGQQMNLLDDYIGY